MTKQKQVFRNVCTFYKKKYTEISHLHKYSDPSLSTLLKHLWQRLQPCVSGYDATGLAHLYKGSFFHYSLQILSSSVRLDGERRCTAIFRSGLWLGHSRTFRDLSQSHSCIFLAVCLGSLSCWKVNLLPSLRSWVLWRKFLSRISLYSVQRTKFGDSERFWILPRMPTCINFHNEWFCLCFVRINWTKGITKK